MKLTHFISAGALALVTACSSSTLPTASGSGPAPSGTTPVTFVVMVPASKSSTPKRLSPHFTDPATQSMTVRLNGRKLLVANLSMTSHDCVSSGSSRRCAAHATAPSGHQTFAVATYDGLNGTGNELATGTIVADLVPNETRQVSIALSGKPAQVAVIVSPAYPPAGTPATATVSVSVLDADGNTIVGDYASAVKLVDDDTSGATHLNATNLSKSSTQVTLAYNGASLASATISAKAAGAITASGIFAPAVTTIAQYTAPPLTLGNKRLPLGVSDLCIGPDGNVWATGASSGAIEKITSNGSFTTYPLPGTEPLGISVGSDKNLWFAENQGGKIGRITTSGVIRSFTIPVSKGAIAQPTWTAPGPDGRTWFTVPEIYANSVIGAIASSGKMSIYPLPTNAGPQEIVAGPDGNLWITDGGLNALDVMSTSGKLVAVHKLQTASAGPWGIAVGPDKNIWFAEFGANLIGRMTLSGTVKEFTPPTGFSGPLNVAAGPDGNVWFTESGGGFWDFDGKIGYVTPDGSIRDFSGGSLHEHVHDLAFDAAGHLWYSKFAFALSALDELVY